MSARDSEFPQRVARLKSKLGDLVEETESISQRARRRSTLKLPRTSTPIAPRVDVAVDVPPNAVSVDERAPTEPPPPPAPSTPPVPEATRYSIVGAKSNRPKKR